MLHPDFAGRLRALPLEYTYGEYRQIYSDFGTHYITEATLGGEYDLTIIINKQKLVASGTVIPSGSISDIVLLHDSMANSFLPFHEGYDLTDTKRCVEAGLKLGVNIKGVYVSVGASGGSCKGLLTEMGGETFWHLPLNPTMFTITICDSAFCYLLALLQFTGFSCFSCVHLANEFTQSNLEYSTDTHFHQYGRSLGNKSMILVLLAPCSAS